MAAGVAAGQHSRAISLAEPYFPFRNTMCSIRGNKQTQGAGHRPRSRASTERGDAERGAALSPDPGTPGELCQARAAFQRLSGCPLSSPKPASLLLCQRWNTPDPSFWASMGVAAVTILFFFFLIDLFSCAESPLAGRIFRCGMQTVGCEMWDLIPQPGLNLSPLYWECKAWRLDHQEVPLLFLNCAKNT